MENQSLREAELSDQFDCLACVGVIVGHNCRKEEEELVCIQCCSVCVSCWPLEGEGGWQSMVKGARRMKLGKEDESS